MSLSNDDLATVAHVGTAVIALIALFRPEISRLFQHYRATIDVHPAAASRLEIGFSNYGPTVGLQGTLRAIGDNSFITTAKVTIERVADHLRHEFDWAIFRQQSLSGSPQQPQTSIEIASGFYLTVEAPRRFNIQFHDTITAERFRQSLTDLQQLVV